MKRSIIGILCLTGIMLPLVGADNIGSAFKDAKLEGTLRSQYFNTNWEVDDKDNATGWALGGSLVYQTNPLYGLSFAAGLYTTQNPGNITDEKDGETASTSRDLFSRDSYRDASGAKVSVPYGEGYSVLAQSYLEYKYEVTKAKAGRFLPDKDNPWMTPNDTKMIPIAVQGAQVISGIIPNTVLNMTYVDAIKERGMTYFGNMADTLDTPSKISSYYSTHYGKTEGVNGDAPGVFIAGATNRSIDNLQLDAWVMHWDDLIDHLRLEAKYALEAGDFIVGFGGLYMKQSDQGAGEIMKPAKNNNDTDNSVDTDMFALRVSADYGAAKLMAAYSHTDEGGGFIAPWRGFPTQFYTRSMTVTDWDADTSAKKVQFDYDFSSSVEGLGLMISYSIYDRNPLLIPYENMTNRGLQNGDTHQWNMDITYNLTGEWKGTMVKLRLMNQENDETELHPDDTSVKEARFEIAYKF